MHLHQVIVRAATGCARCVATVATLFGAGGVAAQSVGDPGWSGNGQSVAPAPAYRQGMSVQLGYDSDYKKATLAYETPNIWGHEFQNGWGRLDLNVELGISYWKATRGGSQSMGQLSAIPMLRWWPNETFYLEVGSGPTVLSRSKFAGREFSTRFQFGSHLGAGILIGKANCVGVRYSHYSNADIKTPNPGLDLVEVAYTYRF